MPSLPSLPTQSYINLLKILLYTYWLLIQKPLQLLNSRNPSLTRSQHFILHISTLIFSLSPTHSPKLTALVSGPRICLNLLILFWLISPICSSVSVKVLVPVPIDPIQNWFFLKLEYTEKKSLSKRQEKERLGGFILAVHLWDFNTVWKGLNSRSRLL